MDVIIKTSKKEKKDITLKLIETENNKSRLEQKIKEHDHKTKIEKDKSFRTTGPVKAFKTRIIGKNKATVDEEEGPKIKRK